MYMSYIGVCHSGYKMSCVSISPLTYKGRPPEVTPVEPYEINKLCIAGCLPLLKATNFPQKKKDPDIFNIVNVMLRHF